MPGLKDFNTLPIDEILTLWRTERADFLLRDFRETDGFVTRLLAVTPSTIAASLSERESKRYSLAMAVRVQRHLDLPLDLRASWALAAAIDGSLVARITLARDLRHCGLRGLAARWRYAISNQLEIQWTLDVATTRRANRSWDEDLVAVIAPPEDKVAHDVKRAEPMPAEDEAAVKGPSLTVIRGEIPTVGGNGKDVIKAYERLTRPLPLAGHGVSPEALATALDMEFPWMAEATRAIRDDLILRHRAGSPWLRFRPILLVGPPGTGKTRWARRLARLAGTGFGEISAAGSSDNRSLAGTARGWGSTQPGLVPVTMLRTGTANPVMVVDEIEKAGVSTWNGRIQDTLLSLLEPETAAAWPDECLLTQCDLSQVSWVMTANSLQGLSQPLLSRVRVIHTGTPAADDWPALFEGLRRDLAADLGLPVEQLPDLQPAAEARLREAFAEGVPVRRLKAALERALAQVPPVARMMN